ncbi:4Fe-4S ferredoxin N-terminal domain-containing protein [Halopenitus sp. H-Gu1]|uniref:4Fe-4S ferredoxin N-terminal domain-containing protein n=1 Tax=Halopenitus sp. H-Gu1 TaxID=3242697 RepID=UPI00359D12FB
MTHPNDESTPVPFDDEWEERAAEQLAETEFDTELGVELAKDAQRVVAGELSEPEFHEKYHDTVREEFDVDERAIETGVSEAIDTDEGEAGIVSRASNAFDDEASRREVVKKGGAVAMGLSMLLGDSDAASAAVSDEPNDDGTRLGMVINLNNCDGCLECVEACKRLHGTSRGAHWIYVMAYADPDQADENFFVRTCMHCGDAPCEKVCPVGARHTREKDGLVLTDYDICIGCRYCMVSCPYGANYFQWGDPDTPRENEGFTHDEREMWVDGPPPNGAMGKCTFEPAWQDGQAGEKLVGTTMCEMACQRDAIHFGDLNDPESDPNQHIREYREAHPNDRSKFDDRTENTVSTFRAMEDRGTDPGVIFIGNEPSEDARQVEGPVSYEEFGLIDDRKSEVLDAKEEANNGGEQA